MFTSPLRHWLVILTCGLVLGGCANQAQTPYDYTDFKASKPASILVLPPANITPSVRASDSVWAQITQPLSESGYYVFPVSLVDASLKQNGVNLPGEAHQLPLNKLSQVFGADAVLYLEVTEYGTVFKLLDSVTTVTVKARLVEARNGKTLWEGTARASDAENRQQQQGGLLGMLVTAVVNQIASNIRDISHPIAGVASRRLLSAGSPKGMLYGPRHPKHAEQFDSIAPANTTAPRK